MEVFDNGTGMNKGICTNNFLSIGDNSFWATKQCFDLFGNVKEKASIIASHGIGVLSYFLLANEIELFSKYKDSCRNIHIDIVNDIPASGRVESIIIGTIYSNTW